MAEVSVFARMTGTNRHFRFVSTGFVRGCSCCSLVLLVERSLIPVKERERVSGKVSNERFVNSCLTNSPSVYIYTFIRTL